ncbi:hypothetical protein [Chlorobium limicola]|uniref:Uncharacterized protein n=1 Tax=Chlorobium limicola TaxID=1092 RepID=A0A117MMH2_CHLLI|nr:hypothetical protein [Chlorobium limicola]KUL25241.1 hypothetical protein ASB62_06740 [Chlorobium limicola]
MKKQIFERYEMTAGGSLIIDVAARRIEDLYENFDKSAPYHRKDLDGDLVAYISGCVREIGRKDFVVRFSIEQPLSEELMDMVRTGMHAFFIYQKELEYIAMKKMMRTSFFLLVTGIVILGVSLRVNHLLALSGTISFPNSFFAEGLTIVAWVSIWEGLATFLLNWAPHLFRTRLYQRIAVASVLFRLSERHVEDEP